ncbi:YecA family protein [Bacillus alkalicellulosilyticus]|uniref:YecA family protein n=1 Tax=Alkalihalobacterium alkalicellulosilyticum TaxID=1912214 RepID=UPI000998D50E|nr:SEC-C metal-binding domain-containing protein [Bacillus alkalicellulosilyticus]
MRYQKSGKTDEELEEILEAFLMEQEGMMKKWLKKVSLPRYLTDELSLVTKTDLDKIRKNLGIKNVSQLNKKDLIVELVKQIPATISENIVKLDVEAYSLVKKVVKHSFYHTDTENIELQKVQYLQDLLLVFPGEYQGKPGLYMTEEIKKVFSENDGPELETIVRRNTEWITLTHGMLYYYGFLDIHNLMKLMKKYTDKDVPVNEFLDALLFAAKYYEQIIPVLNGFEDYRVENSTLLAEEQQRRNDLSFYPFTKKQLLEAGQQDFVETTPEIKQFIKLLQQHFTLTKADIEDIVFDITVKVNTEASPTEMMDYLQEHFEIPSFKFMEQITEKLMNIHNSTRMWVLKGHKPKELFHEEKKHLQPLPTAPFSMKPTTNNKVVDINSYKKTGRNELCPCGSGKKFKKCCIKS